MTSTQLSTPHSDIEEHVVETSGEEKPVAEGAEGGFWGTLRWRAQNIYWNYMGQLAQEGLVGSSGDFDDP